MPGADAKWKIITGLNPTTRKDALHHLRDLGYNHGAMVMCLSLYKDKVDKDKDERTKQASPLARRLDARGLYARTLDAREMDAGREKSELVHKLNHDTSN